MASGYTTATANAILDDQFGTSARVAPTTPIKLAVETVAGTASAAGTELGSTPRATVSCHTASAQSAASSGTTTVTAGASGTVVAIAIWDSAGTPIRKAFG